MSIDTYITQPPIYDIAMDADKRLSEPMRTWLIKTQGALNDFIESFMSGLYQTYAGSTTQIIAEPAIKAGDFALVAINTSGVSPVSVLAQSTQDGQITVTLSADPGADHILSWLVISHSSGA